MMRSCAGGGGDAGSMQSLEVVEQGLTRVLQEVDSTLAEAVVYGTSLSQHVKEYAEATRDASRSLAHFQKFFSKIAAAPASSSSSSSQTSSAFPVLGSISSFSGSSFSSSRDEPEKERWDNVSAFASASDHDPSTPSFVHADHKNPAGIRQQSQFGEDELSTPSMLSNEQTPSDALDKLHISEIRAPDTVSVSPFVEHDSSTLLENHNTANTIPTQPVFSDEFSPIHKAMDVDISTSFSVPIVSLSPTTKPKTSSHSKHHLSNQQQQQQHMAQHVSDIGEFLKEEHKRDFDLTLFPSVYQSGTAAKHLIGVFAVFQAGAGSDASDFSVDQVLSLCRASHSDTGKELVELMLSLLESRRFIVKLRNGRFKMATS